MRGRLRWCNFNMFGMVDLKISEIVYGLNQMENKILLPSENFTEEDFASRRIYKEIVWHNLRKKESIINQK